MQGPRTNASGWAQAGRDAGKSYANIAETTRKYSPRYDELAEVGLKTRSQEKQAAIAAESKARQADISAETLLKKTDIAIDKSESINKSKGTIRKAGMVAAAGSAIGMALIPDEEPVRPETVDFSKYDEYFADAQAKDKADLANRFGGSDRTNPDAGTDTIQKVTHKPNQPGSTSFQPKGGPAGKAPTPSGIAQGDPWKPLSAVIRYAEGTSGDKGYTTQFTGTQFTDMSRHPRQIRSSGNFTSDAAGAYQFLSTTWKEAKDALNLPDFSPASQEKAGRYLAETKRGVNLSKPAANIDEFRGIMDQLAPEWAGLPYSGVSPGGFGRGSSYHGQGGKDLNTLWNIYQQSF